MAKTTIYIELQIGAHEPAARASIVFRTPYRYVDDATVTLPEPAPVILDEDGTGYVTLDAGVWLVDEVLPTQVIRRAVSVPVSSGGTVRYADLTEISNPVEIGFGPSWAAVAYNAAREAEIARDETAEILATDGFIRKATVGLLNAVFTGTDGGFGAGSKDETPHLTFQSWQSPHNFTDPNGPGVNNIGGYGQFLRFDVMQPLAKGLLVWRGPINPAFAYDAANNPLIDKVWMGWHHRHQNSNGTPGSVTAHQHWSIETPDENGDIQTRFQIKTHDVEDVSEDYPQGRFIGLKKTRIITTAADFVVVTSPDMDAALRIVGSSSATTHLEISTTQAGDAGKRWDLQTFDTNLATMALRRYTSSGTLLERPAYVIDRETGKVAFNTFTVGAARFLVSYAGGSDTGLHVDSESLGANDGATYLGTAPNSAHALMRGMVRTETIPRFQVSLAGLMQWGPGTGALDTNLYRHSGGRIITDGDLQVAKNFRVGASTGSGGMQGGIVLAAVATAPTSNASATLIYSEGGIAKIRSAAGVTMQLAQQAAIANPTDAASTMAALISLLTAARTIGLIAT